MNADSLHSGVDETKPVLRALNDAYPYDLEQLLLRHASDYELRDFAEDERLFDTRDYLQHFTKDDLVRAVARFVSINVLEEFILAGDEGAPLLCGGAKTASQERELYEKALAAK